MKQKPKKPKRPPNQFNFCPKHGVFFASCGCQWKGKKKKEVEITVEEIEETNE